MKNYFILILLFAVSSLQAMKTYSTPEEEIKALDAEIAALEQSYVQAREEWRIRLHTPTPPPVSKDGVVYDLLCYNDSKEVKKFALVAVELTGKKYRRAEIRAHQLSGELREQKQQRDQVTIGPSIQDLHPDSDLEKDVISAQNYTDEKYMDYRYARAANQGCNTVKTESEVIKNDSAQKISSHTFYDALNGTFAGAMVITICAGVIGLHQHYFKHKKRHSS